VKLALLNTSIATENGVYELRPLALAQARHLVHKAIEFEDGIQSHIGHDATASIMSTLLGIPVPMDRTPLAQQQGQGAIVLKLGKEGQMFRAEEGRIYSVEDMEEIGYSLKLLVRLPDAYLQSCGLHDLVE
jgi:Domain of unknown function (DUF1874)